MPANESKRPGALVAAYMSTTESFTVPEIAESTGVHPSTIYTYLDDIRVVDFANLHARGSHPAEFRIEPVE